MDKIQQAVITLYEIDREAGKRRDRDSIHPVSRLLVTIGFVMVTVSFHRYDLLGVLSMVLYLICFAIWEGLSVWEGVRRFRVIILLLFFLGCVNPFLDQTVITHWGGISVTGGFLSMGTLFLKGFFAVCSTYFLVVMTGIQGICQGLKILHVPAPVILVLQLIYRYLIVFLEEVQRMQQAYRLRAPGQYGIHMKTWGSFVGLLLLRGIDRGGEVYHSMLLRGYDAGEMRYYSADDRNFSVRSSVLYVVVWLVVFAFLRGVPMFELVGSLL